MYRHTVTSIVSLLTSLCHGGMLTCMLCCSSPSSHACSLASRRVAHGQRHPDALRLCGTVSQLHRDVLWVFRGRRDPGWALAPVASCRQACHDDLIHLLTSWTADQPMLQQSQAQLEAEYTQATRALISRCETRRLQGML